MAKKSRQTRHKPKVKRKTCRVLSVYDGDTITVSWTSYSWFGLKKHARQLKIRLAYIDTPELRYKQPGAVQAKELLEKLAQGRRIIVEYEQLPTGGPRKGDFKRVLAVVHLQRAFLPNINLNHLLLKKGLARLYEHPDNITPHHWNQFRRAERYARRHYLGIWQFSKGSETRARSKMLVYLFIGILIGLFVGLALT